MTKICNVCFKNKELEDFYKDHSKVRNECKNCCKDYIRLYRIKNLEKLRSREKEQYIKHRETKIEHKKRARLENPENSRLINKKCRDKYKEKYNEKRREDYKKDPEKFKDRSLKSHFGIGITEYKQLLEIQNNTCAICNNPETVKRKGKLKNLAVDHCHKTGKIRGLLCARCNKAIGLLKDDINIINNCVNYLQKAK